MRRIAYESRELWERWAPFASASFLVKQWPAARGGLSLPGWQGVIMRKREEYPELQWFQTSSGKKPRFTDPLPDPIWLDEQTQDDSSVEILSSGDYRSTKLLRMNEAQSKDPVYLLEAHGFDPCEWELVTAKNNIWNVYSKSDDPDNPHNVSTLYSSRLTAKPLKTRFDLEAIVAAVTKVKPVKVERPVDPEALMLELGYHDMHFGVSSLETYQCTLERSIELIRSRKWDTILIPVGSDLFHNDNFRSTTAKGTPIEGMDWTVSWADAATFYVTLITWALKHGLRVVLVYIRGNHDESMAWAFCQFLAVKFPRLEVELEICERKVFSWQGVAIGMTHGGKSKASDLDRLFRSEFPEFNNALIKEIHTGHEHHEETEDKYGVLVRKAPSRNKTDGWHSTRGFVGAEKRFTVFWYSPGVLEGIRYV